MQVLNEIECKVEYLNLLIQDINIYSNQDNTECEMSCLKSIEIELIELQKLTSSLIDNIQHTI